MTFARITYTLAMDLIRQSVERETTSPTDVELATYCGLDEATSVRTLLADLADRGDITIRGAGDARVITLGRQRAVPTPAPRPVPSVTKPAKSIDKTVDEIKAILARGKEAVAPKPAPEKSPPRREITREEPGTTETTKRLRLSPIQHGRADTSEQAQDRQVGESPAVIPAPHPVMAELEQIPPAVVETLTKPALEMVRMPTKGARGRPNLGAPARTERKQVNIHLYAEHFNALEAMADANDLQTSSQARMLVIAGLDRPRIPAKVVTAATRAGVPVIQFAAEMMERGLADWLVAQNRERVA